MNPAYFSKYLAIVAGISLLAATQVQAHAFLDHTSPVVGSTIKQAPPTVELWYTQGLEPAFSRVQVFDASNKQIDKKDAHVDPKNDHLLTISLPMGLSPGTYKVKWRVVSVDTHATEGSFTFRVE